MAKTEITIQNTTSTIFVIVNHNGEKSSPWVVRTFVGSHLFLKTYPNKKAAIQAANTNIGADVAA